MKDLIIRNLLRPLSSRLGTAAATWLIAQGADADLTNQLVQMLCAAALVAIDLVFASRNRKAGVE